jgi:cytochrome c-type biogenesis protein CcmH
VSGRRISAPRTALRASLALAATVLVALGLPLASAQPAAPPPDSSSIDMTSLVGPPTGRPLTGDELERATVALASRMRCPVCQGMSVADSPAASAVAMLGQTRDLLERGYTEQQVLDYFVRSYGEFVLLEPTARGFNLVVWLAPAIAVLAGAALIARRLRAARAATASLAATGDAGDDDEPDLDPYLDRVRSEARR